MFIYFNKSKIRINNRVWEGSLPSTILLLVGFLLLQPSGSKAQNQLFNHYKDKLTKTQSGILSNMEQQKTTKRVRLVYIENNWNETESIQLNLFPDVFFHANRKDIGYTGIQSKSWTGSLENDLGSACFVIKGSRISGKVNTAIGNFGIYPLGDEGVHAILEYDRFQFKPCGSDNQILKEPSRKPVKDGKNAPNHDHKLNFEKSESDNRPASNVATGFECNTRVIVAYTDNASANTSSILGMTMIELIDLAVLESNLGYANSNVIQRMELACLYNTDYVEEGNNSNLQNDVDRFQDPSDGNADEIHDLRDQYDADMCCLITDGTSSLCGRAFDFDYDDPDDAFQVTEFGCATGNFSFAHEFGHTQGCRHDTDGSNNPFSQGHGFTNGTNFRTIMAVSDISIPRINFWSNPDVSFMTFGATGVANTNDNADALDFGGSTTAEHRETPVNYTLPSSVVENDETADAFASNQLIADAYVAESGSRVDFRAGKEVILRTGFHAQDGSAFHGYLFDSCPDTPLALAGTLPNAEEDKLAERLFTGQNFGQENQDNIHHMHESPGLVIQPNPFSSTTSLKVVIPDNQTQIVTLEIYNAFGLKIHSIYDKTVLKAGIYEVEYSAHQIPSGVYFALLKTNTHKISQKLIVRK